MPVQPRRNSLAAAFGVDARPYPHCDMTRSGLEHANRRLGVLDLDEQLRVGLALEIDLDRAVRVTHVPEVALAILVEGTGGNHARDRRARRAQSLPPALQGIGRQPPDGAN